MTWHPIRWLASKLVPEARPRDVSVPVPSADFQPPCDCEKEKELERMEREVHHAFKVNELALMSSAKQSYALMSAEARSRRMLQGLMQRMDKGQ